MITAIVVDDDDDMAYVFADYLKIKKVEVLGKGHNGKEAVELYLKFRPDLVFLDLLMPEYDGLYALEKIREHDPYAKVIIITAHRTYGEKILQKLKPTAIFHKPFDLSKVTDILLALNIQKNLK